LKRYSYFDEGPVGNYFDDDLNAAVMRKVAEKCYLPTNQVIYDLICQHKGRFKVAYSISGVAIEQMKSYSPETLESFQKLAKTGFVEFISETYNHSLSSLSPSREFERQVELHREVIDDTFGYQPKVFRNTELIYSDLISDRIQKMGFKAAIAEGADDVLDWRSPNFVYHSPGSKLKLLLKNYRLSDDIAFRFSNREWAGWPLTTEKYAGWVKQISGNGDLLNLFMDYETFGEHQWADHGIFEFLKYLPDAIFRLGDWDFATPSEVIERYSSRGEISFSRLVSWADIERDITAWMGNDMQKKAWEQVYSLEKDVLMRNNPELTKTWRNLQTSDHFYYMCTKWFADGDVHAYFSPYESPYDAFIYFENALKNLNEAIGDRPRRIS
jgi:alpha-amylase